MAFRLVPDAIDVIVVVSKQLVMIDAKVVKIRHIQHVIAPPAVRIDDAAGATLRSMIGIKVVPEALEMILV